MPERRLVSPGERSQRPGEPPSPPQHVYARKATGMVREVSMIDMLAFNGAATGGGAAVITAIGLFYVFAAFPGANLVLVLVLATAVAGFVWLSFALLAATFPKAGGDYLFASRVLHPVAGFASNLGAFASTALSVGFWGYLATTIFIVPIFGIIGTVTGGTGWLDAGETLSSKGWTVAVAVAVIVLVSVLSGLRTRLVARLNTILFAIGMAGFVTALAIMLLKSRQGFESAINDFSRPFTNADDTYRATIEAGREGGLVYPSESGYSQRSTIGAFYAALAVVLYSFWGTYMTGEMKGGGRRSRQLGTILGSGYLQAGLVLLATLIFLSTAGYEFFAAANAGYYGIEVSPYFNFFASVAAGNDLVAVLLGISFLGFLLPGIFINLAMCQRALFAWSFDGLLPARVAEVHPRTHTPVVAIGLVAALGITAAFWITYDSNFVTALTVTGALLALPILLTGISAIMLSGRRPEIYDASPADWTVIGVPVIRVAGLGCTTVACVYIGLLIYFHAELGIPSAATLPIVYAACFAAAGLYYWAARRWQAGRGVDLDLVYKTIPPD